MILPLVQLLIEATVVGISTVVMGSIVGFIISQIVLQINKGSGSSNGSGSSSGKTNGDWNKYYVMEIALFFTGFFLHIVYELLGLNRWYCKEIYAKTRK